MVLSRYKNEFEYVFHENELLSLEIAKLDVSHKQIAYLEHEIKFKEEESNELHELMSALELFNKKAHVSRLDSAARLADKMDLLAREDEKLENEQNHERFESDIPAFKTKNSMLLKVLDREEMALKLKDEEVAAAHKMLTASLEQTLHNAQGNHLKRAREKLDNNIEIQIQQMEMRRWSSANSCRTRRPLSQS